MVMHISSDDAAMTKIGTLPSGGECIVNRTAVEADLLIAQGFIEPHLFAGFSGGRKSVLPGISSYKTIMANHCSEFINSPKTRPGILQDNPIHKDMLYAAKTAGLRFIVNVILNGDRDIIASFCEMAIIHAHRMLDINLRAEWFDDVNGSRIGTRANYFELTSGLNIMPTCWLDFRPEIRWDGASRSVFGPETETSRKGDQWTFAVDMLVKF
jgi:hypothetical protein